jgi:hypothetical protein
MLTSNFIFLEKFENMKEPYEEPLREFVLAFKKNWI